MRISCTTLLISMLFSCGCQQAAELERTQAELYRVQAAVDAHAERERREAEANKRQLVHLVWFKMDPELTAEQDAAFIAELRKLDDIGEVNDLEIGRFQELGDARAMSELDIVMSMGFDSEQDYRNYQDHPIHVKLKGDIGEYLAGPPVTYDYWTEKE